MVGIIADEKVVTVASGAFSGRPCVLTRQLIAVARSAVGNRMCANQRESFLRMLLKNLTMALPVFRRVACLALRAKLPPMDIGVTIRARRFCANKLEILMTRHALRLTVCSDEREACLTVRKSRWIAHLMPRFKRVTLLAIPANVAMRILILGLGECAAGRPGQHQ